MQQVTSVSMARNFAQEVLNEVREAQQVALPNPTRNLELMKNFPLDFLAVGIFKKAIGTMILPLLECFLLKESHLPKI